MCRAKTTTKDRRNRGITYRPQSKEVKRNAPTDNKHYLHRRVARNGRLPSSLGDIYNRQVVRRVRDVVACVLYALNRRFSDIAALAHIKIFTRPKRRLRNAETPRKTRR